MRPKILLFDIETAPILSYTWGLWDQTVGLNQVHTDWSVLSWAAKWLDEKPVMYQDVRKRRNKNDDKQLIKGIWKLLDSADIVITQNGKAFDSKKLNARFIQHGFKPPKPYQHIDTLKLAKKHFGFTSNKLAYMTEKLCTKYKKLEHKQFPGFDLWKECLAGNLKAWKEMELYNKHDVLALEELYKKLIVWDSSVNLGVYTANTVKQCTCGSTHFQRRGFAYTAQGKYQQYQCQRCMAYSRGRKNLCSK